MFPHKTPIYRAVAGSTTIAGGISINVPSSSEYEIIKDGVACRWSKSGQRLNTTNSDGRESLIVIEYKVFFKKDTDIKRGDRLEFNGRKYLVHDATPVYDYDRLHHIEAEVVTYE